MVSQGIEVVAKMVVVIVMYGESGDGDEDLAVGKSDRNSYSETNSGEPPSDGCARNQGMNCTTDTADNEG